MSYGWIDHDGTGIPVSKDTLVLVRFRDGSPHYDKLGTQRPASKWHSNISVLSNWIHDGGRGDIIAYRIISPTHEPAIPSQALGS